MTKAKLRAIKESELPKLYELWTAAGLHFKSKGRDSMSNLRKQRRKDPSLFVGAFVDDRLVGAAIASDDGRKAWINRLAVAPEARRKGIGTMLINHCEGILRKRGRDIFCAHIEHDNPESMRFFGKAGYRREDLIFYYAKRENKDY